MTEALVPVQEPITWYWDEALEEYLAYVLDHKKPRTWVDYRNMLATPELERFQSRRVATITLKEMLQAVEDVHIEDFMASSDGKEGIWFMPMSERKTAEQREDSDDHLVPLPTPAWAAVQRMLDATDDGSKNPFLFRGIRPRRAGDQVGAIAASNLQHYMMYAPGIAMRPHDTRRCFSREGGERWDWDIQMCRSILDHNEGHGSGNITIKNYRWRSTGPKWDMMRKWCEALEEAALQAVRTDPQLADTAWLAAYISKEQEKHKSTRAKRKGISLFKPRAAAE